MKHIILALFLLLNSYSSAQAQNEAVINEILFSIANESVTSRDRQVYQSVLSEVFQKDRVSQFTKKLSDDFVLSRLSYREAKVFELRSVEVKLNESMKKKLSEFSQREITREVEIIGKAIALIEMKETQLKQKDRFDTWFALLKRKYQLKLKSSDAK